MSPSSSFEPVKCWRRVRSLKIPTRVAGGRSDPGIRGGSRSPIWGRSQNFTSRACDLFERRDLRGGDRPPRRLQLAWLMAQYWSRMGLANAANAAAPRGVTEREFPCCPSLESTAFYDGSVAKDRLSSDLFGCADVDLISPADSGEKS
jgi:hypothetical protein